jgi:hypothetical protein
MKDHLSKMKVASIVFFWVLLLLLFHRCQNDIAVPPVVTIDDSSEYRQTMETDFEFKVSISRPSRSDVSVEYTTKDGTAIGGVDFIVSSGTATIPAGSLSTTIKVNVRADSLRRDSQIFYLSLSNPKNCTIAGSEAVGRIYNSDGLYLPFPNTGDSTPGSYPGYTLVWNDEFNGQSVDANNWAFELGNGGWGTHELQNYTNQTKNAFVSSGNLIIEARKDFTSARITTKGKKNFKYGRIDIRAKLPCSQGIMSSIWMLGSNVDAVGQPTCGEIDFVQVAHAENVMYNVLHWSDAQHTAQQFGRNQSLGVVDDKFHVFSIVWDADQIVMFLDDVQSFYMSTVNEALPFNNDFFFIFNVAVGGDWPGPPDNTTQFPQRMVVDYVRVFQ